MKNILKKYLDYNVTYSNGLTNHLPMAMYALHSLGGDDDRLVEFAESYIVNRKLEFVTSSDILIDEKNYKSYLGQYKYYEAYRGYFEKELLKLGKKELLNKYKDLIAEGLSSAAFHGIIKLAYAIEMDFHDEIICAMAYLCIAYQEIDVVVKRSEKEVFKGLSEDDHFKSKTFSGRSIFSRIKEVSEDDHFIEVASLGMSDLDDIRPLVLDLYMKTQNFTVLHMVTSTHALRILMPYLKVENLIDKFFLALQAAYLSTNCVVLDKTIDSSDMTWDQIKSEAIELNDDHGLKLIYTCYSEYQDTGNDLYRLVAIQTLRKEV